MDSWFDLIRVPPTRHELHYGSRIVRCFVDRPEGVHAMLAGAVARRPEGVALICAERSVTYRELDRLVGRAAAGLAARGIGQDDRVALMLGSSIEFVVLLFAAARLGAVSVPLSTRQQAAENRYVLGDCGAKLVVYEDSLADRLPDPSAVPTLEHAVPVRRDRSVPMADLLADTAITEPTRVPEEAVATILYTSGTTGRPKMRC